MNGISLEQEVLGKILVQKFLGALDLVSFFKHLNKSWNNSVEHRCYTAGLSLGAQTHIRKALKNALMATLI